MKEQEFTITRTLIPDYFPVQKRRGKMVEVRDEPKIGRNAPCPCGSGKKSKKCCKK